jgi:DNA mismatch repair protein MutS
MELPSNLTPAMKQFKRAKEQYPDAIIFFRMGDFYETFYDDAKVTAKELEITLTKRGTKAQIPLAGIPYHALDNYLPKLVKKGYKVAICEQMEDPKLAKGVVKRDIIRVVTPGTLTESLDEKNNNFIMCLAFEKDKYGLAVADISTGDFWTTDFKDEQHLVNEVTRYMPSELLVDFPLNTELKTFIESKKIFLQRREQFSYRRAYECLTRQFNTISLEGFGIETRDAAVIASGELMLYLRDTQKADLNNIKKIQVFSPEKFMILDSSTLRNLEITSNIIDGSSKNTLLEAIDNTTTAMGSRLLKQWLKRPLINLEQIKSRHHAVALLKDNSLARAEITDALKDIYDVERLISRINYGTANPRDLLALKNSLLVIPKLKQVLSTLEDDSLLKELSQMDTMKDVVFLIHRAIREEPPISVREGGFIKPGYNPELDELHSIKSSGKDWILKLEQEEKEKLGVNLKIGFNKVFGYYIEVTKKNIHAVPDTYIRKQTTANAERFITDSLKEKEELILGAEEKINDIEYRLFMNILQEITKSTVKLQEISQKIATVDILTSFASAAYVNNYCMPEMTQDYDIIIKNGRHPVIEMKQNEFVPNNTQLDMDTRTAIITGPNMAGKSTYMRQVASICLLAQIGSFIPADEARLAIVDRIFTRVGAYDNLVMGQSTFMVEMNETANILNNATSKSLIILDEIGRGTSTFDGVSIAWSVVEYITNKIKAKTLFATHYHALNKLSREFKEVKNYNIAVKERDDEIIFLRKIVEGGTDKSYGIQVARLAGLPLEVINRSKEIMTSLEKEDEMKKKLSGSDMKQVSLYDALR